MTILKNNQKKSHGGARPGSGRKKGSTQKLSAVDLLDQIARKDKPFAVGLAEDYAQARRSGNQDLVVKYQQMILSKVIADRVEQDVTSNGETLVPQIVFAPQELEEWRKRDK